MRYIVVEAEQNRYSEDTQESMANAIMAFERQPADDAKMPLDELELLDSNMPNIHTITIRVSPSWGEDGLTFQDFFKPNSPVIKALEKTECQFLRVDLMHKALSSSKSSKTGSRFLIDMRHLRLLLRSSAGLYDFWKRDKLVIKERRIRAVDSIRQIRELHSHVMQCCEKARPVFTYDDATDTYFDPTSGTWLFADMGV